MSSTAEWHTHACKSCGQSYQHEHKMLNADHQQDDFQCPYEDCENYFRNGTSPRPPRNTRLMEGSELIIKAKKDESQVPPVKKERPTDRPNETNWEKTVRIKYHQDEITCKNAAHFKKRWTDKAGAKLAHAVPERKALLRILGEMDPFKKAACTCERDACREAWTWNEPGTWQTEFVMPGTYQKGVGKVDDTMALKRVMPVKCRLTPAQFSTLHTRFPDWHFVQVRNGGHDHPVSHITTQVVTYELFESLRGKCLDLHGNPTANENRNSSPGAKLHTTTYVNLVTPKDYYRKATKWGAETAAGKTRWHTGAYIRDAEVHMADLLKDKNVITSIHTGYYYEQSEILSILRGAKENATFEMLMHRFEGTSGTFNNGELSWEKRGGEIHQTNNGTLESYAHPTNEHWFQRGSWTDVPVLQSCKMVEDNATGEMIPNAEYDAPRGLAWSTCKVTDGVYKVSVVACPAHAVHNDGLGTPVLGSTVAEVRKTGEVVIDMGAPVSVPIREEHAELFDVLRTSMVSCSRSEAKYKSHVNTVKQKCQSFFVEKKLTVLPDSQSVSNLIEASFWVDFRRDCSTASHVHTDAQWYVKQYDLALAGKALNKAGNVIGLSLDLIALALRAKTGKETAAALLESFRLVNTKV